MQKQDITFFFFLNWIYDGNHFRPKNNVQNSLGILIFLNEQSRDSYTMKHEVIQKTDVLSCKTIIIIS